MSKPKKPVFPTKVAEDAFTQFNTAIQVMDTLDKHLKSEKADGTNAYSLLKKWRNDDNLEDFLKELGTKFCTALQDIYNEFVNIKDHEYYNGKGGAEHE